MTRSLASSVKTVAPALAVATALGYLLFVSMGRLLGPTDFALFAAYWGLLFAVGGMAAPLEQETARLVAGGVDPRHPHLVRMGLLVGVGLVAAVLLSYPVTVGRVLDGSWELALLVVVAAMGFAVQNVVRGVELATRGRRYAGLVVAEPVVRLLALVLLVGALGSGVVVGAAAVVTGSFVWLFSLRTRGRSRPAGVDPPSLPRAVRQLVLLIVAAGCTAGVVTGFPAVAAAFAPPGTDRELGTLVAALTVTRLPLLVFGPVQAVLVPLLVQRRSSGEGRSARRLLVQVVLSAAVGTTVLAAAALAVGPWFVRLLYGAEFVIGRVTLALLTLGAGVVVVQLLLAAAVLALGRHAWVLASWASCFAVVLLTLATWPGSLTASVIVAVLAAPVLGAAVAVVGLTRPQVASGQRSSARPGRTG